MVAADFAPKPTENCGGFSGRAVHRHLAALTAARAKFRAIRTWKRIRSPRRIVATLFACLFFLAYVGNAWLIMSSRAAADPAQLRLWLSGGMVLYLIYHAVRCVWTRRQEELEFSAAEQLWLGGAPIPRSTLAVYFIYNVFVSAVLKTGLLVVVLVQDVPYVSLLALGVFVSMVLLETVRLVWQRWTAGLTDRHRLQMRVAVTAIAIAAVIQAIVHLVAMTPPDSSPGHYLLNSFRAIGALASCDVIQWLALPWWASSALAVTVDLTWATIGCLVVTCLSIPAAVGGMVSADAWSWQSQLRQEKRRLASGAYSQPNNDFSLESFARDASWWMQFAHSALPERTHGTLALIWRQSMSIRRYAGTIFFSFTVPTVLCLSPLLTGGIKNQWSYVVGGIAMSTLLLAPPALRIDFRRDLKRILLLRSLPLNPIGMVCGQLALPILITLLFQWTTILIAAMVTSPGWDQVIVWTGLLSALAVGTFAAENALFLTYPHHERAQGIGMVIRAKVVFLAKVLVIVLGIAALLVWLSVCRQFLPSTFATPSYVAGAVLFAWGLAIAVLLLTAWCWKRFDVAHDVPPE